MRSTFVDLDYLVPQCRVTGGHRVALEACVDVEA